MNTQHRIYLMFGIIHKCLLKLMKRNSFMMIYSIRQCKKQKMKKWRIWKQIKYYQKKNKYYNLLIQVLDCRNLSKKNRIHQKLLIHLKKVNQMTDQMMDPTKDHTTKDQQTYQQMYHLVKIRYLILLNYQLLLLKVMKIRTMTKLYKNQYNNLWY